MLEVCWWPLNLCLKLVLGKFLTSKLTQNTEKKNTCLACKAKKHQTCHMSKKAQYSLRAQHMLTIAPKPNSRNVFELCRVYCSLVGAFQNMDLTPNLTPTSLQRCCTGFLQQPHSGPKNALQWSHQALEREKNEALSTGNFCDLVFPRNRKPSTLSKKCRWGGCRNATRIPTTLVGIEIAQWNRAAVAITNRVIHVDASHLKRSFDKPQAPNSTRRTAVSLGWLHGIHHGVRCSV